MSITVFTASLTLLATCAFSDATPPKENSLIETNAVLQNRDIKEFQHEASAKRPWVIASKDTDIGPIGLEQKAKVQGVTVFIWYAECTSNDLAHKVMVSHLKNLASRSAEGMWPSAQNQAIGDQTWHFLDEQGLAFRSGRVIVVVSCHSDDKRKGKQVAELVATTIANKIKCGGRVVIPVE